MEFQGAIWVAEIWAAAETRKKLGEQAEAAFLNKATGLGLSVAKPWGDSERYDLIVGSGRRLWRVQVKSTRYVGERRFSITACGVIRRSRFCASTRMRSNSIGGLRIQTATSAHATTIIRSTNLGAFAARVRAVSLFLWEFASEFTTN